MPPPYLSDRVKPVLWKALNQYLEQHESVEVRAPRPDEPPCEYVYLWPDGRYLHAESIVDVLDGFEFVD